MSSDTLERLQQLDIALLTDVVRQDQRSPAFEILDWTVKPLSHEKIIDTTGGLYLFNGHGRDEHESKPWSVVLKILNKPQKECLAPREWCYWKREMLAFQSGLLTNIPTALNAPRSFGVYEYDDDAWIWIEHIVESTDRVWGLEQFRTAARQAGRFGGAYLEGVPLPDYPWLSEPFLRSALVDGDWWATFMNPASVENVWQSPIVQGAFTESLRSQVLRIWAEKHRFFDVLDRLPQVFCHNDLHRRNLMIRTDANGHEELIVLDWAFSGVGAMGSDLGPLVATSSHFFDFDPARVVELEAAVLESYRGGLNDAGWTGDSRLVRLGYLIAATLWTGATLPGWAAIMLDGTVDTMAMYGRPREEVLAGWVTLCEIMMGRAEEGRRLMSELGLR